MIESSHTIYPRVKHKTMLFFNVNVHFAHITYCAVLVVLKIKTSLQHQKVSQKWLINLVQCPALVCCATGGTRVLVIT